MDNLRSIKRTSTSYVDGVASIELHPEAVTAIDEVLGSLEDFASQNQADVRNYCSNAICDGDCEFTVDVDRERKELRMGCGACKLLCELKLDDALGYAVQDAVLSGQVGQGDKPISAARIVANPHNRFYSDVRLRLEGPEAEKPEIVKQLHIENVRVDPNLL